MSDIKQKSSAHFSTAALALLEAVAWTEEELDEARESEEGKGKQGSGSAGGPLFKDVVKTVRGNWKQLLGGDLLSALKEFGIATRASANLVVSWIGDFTIIQDIFDQIEELVYGKERERKRDMWRKGRKTKIAPAN